MTEIEKLKRRLQSWHDCTGPRWLLNHKGRIMEELRAEIARLEAAERFRPELDRLAAMPDSEIDTSDIPETTDWSGAKRGRFARKGRTP